MKVGRLLLRTTVGGFFVGHGTQKLFGWFGGNGLSVTAEYFEGMGLRPGKVQATTAGLAESAGGAALALGYRTPLASAALISVMLTAINRVHRKNGIWASNKGYEYNLVLLLAAATLAEVGPGKLSLDALRGKRHEGARWGLFALALGGTGAAAAHLLSEQAAQRLGPAASDEPASMAEPATPAYPAEAAVRTVTASHTWATPEPESGGEGAAADPEPAQDAEAGS